jgi:hypothetical protein
MTLTSDDAARPSPQRADSYSFVECDWRFGFDADSITIADLAIGFRDSWKAVVRYALGEPIKKTAKILPADLLISPLEIAYDQIYVDEFISFYFKIVPEQKKIYCFMPDTKVTLADRAQDGAAGSNIHHLLQPDGTRITVAWVPVTVAGTRLRCHFLPASVLIAQD